MNGDSLELYTKLKEEIAKTTLKNEVLWEEHNKSAQQYRDTNYKALNKIESRLDRIEKTLLTRPCEMHKNEMGWLKTNVYTLWAAVTVGVVTIVKLWIGGL